MIDPKHEAAHSAPLYALLRDHHWKLKHEEEELAERAKAREITGKANSRPKQGWKDMANYVVEFASFCARRRVNDGPAALSAQTTVTN